MNQSLWPEVDNYLSEPHRENLLRRLRPNLESWIKKRGLPVEIWQVIETAYLPLAAYLAREIDEKGCRILGVSGGQGAGKSTLSGLLIEILAQGFDKKGVTFSIDDIYLSHAERQQLAVDVHPLLATRGVPGTHDPLLGLYLLQQLKVAGEGDMAHLPVFDKAIDDRLPPDQWKIVEGPFDLIIFEGWCVGAMPQTEAELHQPVNNLERQEDTEGIWRRFVNDELSGSYLELFAAIDILLMLKVPGMEQVYEWRLKQEEQLRAQQGDNDSASRIMNREQIERFIQHYERISCSMLKEMPERADLVFTLDQRQRIQNITCRKDAVSPVNPGLL
ncbi:MAG: hypothetical protein C0623_13665 [Desulfuromonas sp.]|nr:MAG: hypothetical protein C0623_13665 [Desulfuromonas sp.]